MRFYCTAALLLNLALPAHSATLFVSKTGDGTNGLTWPTAFQEIGAAITASSTGDEIWVKGGRYVENLTTTSPITLLGGFEGTEEIDERDLRDPDENPTIIDGNKLGSVLVVNHDLQVDGLTITKGKGSGSGMRVTGSRVELRDVHLLANGENRNTGRGGGIYAVDSELLIQDCILKGNLVLQLGGGIFASNSAITLIRTTFIDNIAGFAGGGMSITHSNVAIDRCMFSNNRIAFFRTGGGLYEEYGGAIDSVGSTGRCSNSIFIKNSSRAGSEVNSESSRWVFLNCTFDMESSFESFVVFYWETSPPTFRRSNPCSVKR